VNETGKIEFSLSNTDSKFEKFYEKGNFAVSKINFVVEYEDMDRNRYNVSYEGSKAK
jgi:hypothetical protein